MLTLLMSICTSFHHSYMILGTNYGNSILLYLFTHDKVGNPICLSTGRKTVGYKFIGQDSLYLNKKFLRLLYFDARLEEPIHLITREFSDHTVKPQG
jgi:hypothetical protein